MHRGSGQGEPLPPSVLFPSWSVFPSGLGLGLRLQQGRGDAKLPTVFDRNRQPKQTDQIQVAIERGRDGYAAAWCLDLPGCYALVPPGADPIERASVAILEFASWSHNRAAGKMTLVPGQVTIAQALETGADICGGETLAFFLHDGEPPVPGEFPLWATPHDRALDELRELALTFPPGMHDHRLDDTGRTVLEIIDHAAEAERFFASRLHAGTKHTPKPAQDHGFRHLQDSHLFLQQVVCDVPATTRLSLGADGPERPETWSVRKVMRRSIWHLRYHTWELRRAVGSIWLG